MQFEKKTDEVLREFMKIPGVGKKIAIDFWDMGFRSLDELNGQDPEDLYQRLNARSPAKICRCMLYVFRCAVYFVSHQTHDPHLLKWWNWKDTP